MHRPTCMCFATIRQYLLLVLLSLSASMSLLAQEDFVLGTNSSVPLMPYAIDLRGQDKIVIPLVRVSNLFMVEATVDGQTGNFVLDTGAPGLVLNQTYFDGGKLAEATAAYGVTGGGTPVYRYTADSLFIRSMAYNYVRADLAQLGHLENARGVKILGLLGTNLFLDMELELDLANEVLILYRTDKAGNCLHSADEADSGVPDLELPMTVDNNLLFIRGNCDKKKMRFCLDTGAEVNVLNSTSGKKVLQYFELTTRSTLRGSGNQQLSVLNGKLNKLAFETADFNGMPFVLTDLSALEAAYDTYMNGMLGYNFFSKGRIVMNFQKETLKMYFYN
jgi:predicted aspartyl protease